MSANKRQTIVFSILLLTLTLVLAACQRERPAAEQEGWSETPAVQGTGTPGGAAQPTLAITSVSVETAQPGAQVTPLAVVTPLPAALTPVPATTPITGAAVVPAGPTFGYVVKAGDTLFSIALAYGTDVETLRRLNNLPDDTIQVGQVLVVPGTGQAAQPGDQGQTGTTGAVQPTQPVSQVTYTVQAGDNLSGIAAQFGVSWQEVAAANNIQAPNYTIYRGQRLVIPGAVPTTATAAAQRTHVVAAGETLYGIAVQYGVTVQALMQANNITNPNLLSVGQELVVP